MEIDICNSVKDGDLVAVDKSLADGTPPESKDAQGYTLLMQAASRGHDRIINSLVTAGAEIDAEHEFDHYTPLILAARNGQGTAVRALIAAGAVWPN